MSVQVAMMAGMAAMSAYSAVRQGQASGAAAEGQATSAQLRGAGYDVQASEANAQAINEEYNRRVGLSKLLSANRGEISGRGVSGEQGSSYDVIQQYNQEQNNRDVEKIRFMGESVQRRLSFAREASQLEADQYLNMASMARTSGYINAGTALFTAGVKYFGVPKFGGGDGGKSAYAGSAGAAAP